MAKKLILALAMALLVSSAWAGVYRWVDAKGVVHYSDAPPPGAEPLAVDSTPTDPAAVAARKKQRQAKLKQYAQQQQKADQAAAKATQQQEKSAAACTRAQARVNALAAVRRVRKNGADGKVTWLSGDELAQYRQAAEKERARLCRKS